MTHSPRSVTFSSAEVIHRNIPWGGVPQFRAYTLTVTFSRYREKLLASLYLPCTRTFDRGIPITCKRGDLGTRYPTETNYREFSICIVP